MPTSTASGLTPHPEATFFVAPQSTWQRQYEALRAFFVDDLPSAEVARRFSYTPGSFRVLCHQFRHDPAFRARFFAATPLDPSTRPARNPVRRLVVAMRKRNLSVYDIQRELAAAGHTLSINSLGGSASGFGTLPCVFLPIASVWNTI